MNVKFALVAASVIATTLPAQTALNVTGGTNITISGLLGIGLKSASLSQGNAAAARAGLGTETRLDDNTSRLIIASSSKITDGWNVMFRVESRFLADVRPGDAFVQLQPAVYGGNITGNTDATGWADGDTWAGIQSPWGILSFGKNTLYYTDTISAGYLAPSLEAPGESQRVWDANGLATFNMLDSCPTIAKSGAVTNVYTTGNGRSRNVLRFDSRNWSGFDFALAWTKNANGDENKYPNVNTPGVVNINTLTTYGTVTALTAPVYGLAAGTPIQVNTISQIKYTRAYTDGNTIYARARYNGHGFSASASILNQVLNGGPVSYAETKVVANPLTAPATALDVSASAYNGALDTHAMRLGVSYKLPFALKLGVVVDQTKINYGASGGAAWGTAIGDAKRTVFSVPVSYTMGDHGFYATWTKAGDVSSATHSGAKQLNLGYDYALTKRAFLGVWYTKLDNDLHGHYGPFLGGSSLGPTTTATGEGWSQFGINMNYWF